MSPELLQTQTLLREAGQEWLRVPRVDIRLECAGKSRAVTLSLQPVIVGTSPECELVCEDGRVSRRHCRLSLQGGGVLLEDLDSKNGTFVGGVRVGKVWLTPGHVVTLGSSQLSVSTDGSATELPLFPGSQFGAAHGLSLPMRALFAQLDRASRVDATLLLWGETGTGKQLLARAVHEMGSRSEGPFVVLDCASVPESLLEDELFGHEPGAFTSATDSRQGVVEQAAGGTLFLDEIGELPLSAQTRLLRVLEQRSVRRLGGNEDRQVDVRVVAATHRDLRARIAAGAFREDLLYRLSVLELTVPPLRERREDIPLLVEKFLGQMQPPRTLASLPSHLLTLFARHDWPGNARELRNVVVRSVTFPELPVTLGNPAPEAAVKAKTFPHLPLREARQAAVEHFEAAYVKEKLQAHKGNVAAAAQEMGVSRQFVYRMMARYDLGEHG